MASIQIVIEIDEPGVPEETLRTTIGQMKQASEREAQVIDLSSSSHVLPARIVGVVEEKFTALVPYLTGRPG